MGMYAEIPARTSVMKIHNEAVRSEFVAHGEDLVIISSHLPTCEMCKPWNGRIVSLYIPDNSYGGLTEEYLARATEHINEMDEDEKKLLILQLAKWEGKLYNPDNKHGEGIYFADKLPDELYARALYPPNRGAKWGSVESVTLQKVMLIVVAMKVERSYHLIECHLKSDHFLVL